MQNVLLTDMSETRSDAAEGCLLCPAFNPRADMASEIGEISPTPQFHHRQNSLPFQVL
jgi:hypothetical protein